MIENSAVIRNQMVDILRDTFHKISAYGKEIIIGLCLVMISQTKLRIFASIGLGEIILTLLIFRDICRKNKVFSSINFQSTSISCYGLLFFLLILISTGINHSWADLTEKQQLISVGLYHNLIAFLYCGAFFFWLREAEIKLNVLIYAYSILLLTFLLLEIFSLPWDSLFYQGVRFSGLSENPNQLALVLFLLPYFSIEAKKEGYFSNNIYKIVLTISLLLGYFSHSSASILAYSTGCAFYLYLDVLPKIKMRINKANKKLFDLKILIVLAVSILCLIFILFKTTVWVKNYIAVERNHVAQSFNYYLKRPETVVEKFNLKQSLTTPLISFGGEGVSRYIIWESATLAILKQPFWGYGGGAEVILPYKNVVIEAHNTFLDVALKSGFLGLLIYIIFLGFIFWCLWKQKKIILLAAFLGLIIFSLFHNVLRQPITWLYFAYFLYSYSCTWAKKEVFVDVKS